MSLSLEERLTSLEASLGHIPTLPTLKSTITNRIDNIVNSTTDLLDRPTTTTTTTTTTTRSYSSSSTTTPTLQSDLTECRRLYRKLEPTSLTLTSSSSSSSVIETTNPTTTPHLYRRQEILARTDDLRLAFERLGQMRDLLLVSNPGLAKRLSSSNDPKNDDSSGGGDLHRSRLPSSIERGIREAPILSSPVFRFASDETNVERLENVKRRMGVVEQRAADVVERFDSLLDRYYRIVGLVNEKMVLVREYLRDLEKEEEEGGGGSVVGV